MVEIMNSKVTVLMPVYNGERYLRQAMDSILSQTFRDFEFLIIDDGCTDKSVEIINSYADPRICLVHNETNLGLTAVFNRGLDLARGEYIARMDCDDISLPSRLEIQVNFMESYPEVGLCGTWTITDNIVGKYPKTHQECLTYKFFNSPFAHPTVMLRRNLVEKHNLKYSHEYPICDDFELWRRCMQVTKVENICIPLLYYRKHDGNISSICSSEQKKGLLKYYHEELISLGFEPSAVEMVLHYALIRPEITKDIYHRYSFKQFDIWTTQLLNYNNQRDIFIKSNFEALLKERYVQVAFCYVKRLSTWYYYSKSSINSDDRCCIKLLKHALSTIIRKVLKILRFK